MTIHLLNYNNYFNRQVKRAGNWSTDYAPYLANIGALENPIDNVNFVPGDNVNTTLELQLPDDVGTPDYLLVTDPGLYGSGPTDIVSRWFITDATRLRGAFWKLSLYRDTIADFYYQIWNDPMMVHRGMLSADNPLIFNKEGHSFNQVKKYQWKLFDDTKCPWLVGYVPRDAFQQDTQITLPVLQSSLPDYITIQDFSQTDIGKLIGKRIYSNTNGISVALRGRLESQSSYGTVPYLMQYTVDSQLNVDAKRLQILGQAYRPGDLVWQDQTQYDTAQQLAQWPANPIITSGVISATNDPLGSEQLQYQIKAATINPMDSLINYMEGTGTFGVFSLDRYIEAQRVANESLPIYNAANNTYYRVDTEFGEQEYTQLVREDNALWTNFFSPINFGQPYGGGWGKSSIYDQSKAVGAVNVNGGYLIPKLVPIYSNKRIEVTMPASRISTQDQPFDIFCLPYRIDGAMEFDGVDTEKQLDYLTALNIAAKIVQQSTTKQIFDLQLLPYCPVRQKIKNGKLIIEALDTRIQEVDSQSQSTTLGAIYWVSSSNLTIDIPIGGLDAAPNALNKKVFNETRFARLSANNYSKVFDFSLEINNGLKGIRAYNSLRPYSPWIRLTPIWGDGTLYSVPDLQYDAKGLILSGDYSIAQVTDKWAEYKLNNKNFLEIFDRETQHIEFTQGIGMLGAGLGTAGGIVAGAMKGGWAGAGAAAVAGGVGLATKGLGYAESLDYREDMFNLNLGNIQALPNGLAKTAAQTICDSLVPTLQIYQATYQEEQAFRNQIKWNGMRVGAVGTLRDFLPNGGYFKATPIRLSIQDDFHLANTIAEELSKGVYLT